MVLDPYISVLNQRHTCNTSHIGGVPPHSDLKNLVPIAARRLVGERHDFVIDLLDGLPFRSQIHSNGSSESTHNVSFKSTPFSISSISSLTIVSLIISCPQIRLRRGY